MTTIVHEACQDIRPIAKTIKPYKWPVRSKKDLVGNKELKNIIGFLDETFFPPEIGTTLKIYTSLEHGYLVGDIQIEVKEVYKIDNSIAIVAFNENLNEEVYVVIKDRYLN